MSPTPNRSGGWAREGNRYERWLNETEVLVVRRIVDGWRWSHLQIVDEEVTLVDLDVPSCATAQAARDTADAYWRGK